MFQPENVLQEANALSDSVFDVNDVPPEVHNSSLEEGKIRKNSFLCFIIKTLFYNLLLKDSNSDINNIYFCFQKIHLCIPSLALKGKTIINLLTFLNTQNIETSYSLNVLI